MINNNVLWQKIKIIIYRDNGDIHIIYLGLFSVIFASLGDVWVWKKYAIIFIYVHPCHVFLFLLLFLPKKRKAPFHKCNPTRIHNKSEPHMLSVCLVVGIKQTSVKYSYIHFYGCIDLKPNNVNIGWVTRNFRDKKLVPFQPSFWMWVLQTTFILHMEILCVYMSNAHCAYLYFGYDWHRYSCLETLSSPTEGRGAYCSQGNNYSASWAPHKAS